MDETNNSSFIETAMKHHSTTQAAIKSLQHQLDCFEQIRNSTKEIFLLTEQNEKAVEKSAHSLLLSAKENLFETPDSKVRCSQLLTSTLNKKKPDEAVIRNLLPTFEDVDQLNTPNEELDYPAFSPIKPPNQSALTSNTRDSFASTTLPPTPLSDAVKNSVAPLNALGVENSQSPLSKNFSVVAPSSGCMNLSEVLARLAYSSALNGTASGVESFGSNSDELISLLEKIAKTGEQLKIELQEARLRESVLLKEVHHLRGQQNGFRPNGNHRSPTEIVSPHHEVLKAKCEKLEDALLSLQDENMKLNRQLKFRSPPDVNHDDSYLKGALQKANEENFILKDQLEKIRHQLTILEDKEQTSQSQARLETACQQNEEAKFAEERRQRREAETEVKGMTARLNDLNNLLAEKDEKLFAMEEKLRSANDASRLSLSRCEDLEKKDVYKRKEVLQLCDKFEKMKKGYKKMENELAELKKKERDDVTRKWAFENSIQKVAQESKSIQSRMQNELQKMTMDKLLIEKDYNLLKKRYESLLERVGKSSDEDERLPGRSANRNAASMRDPTPNRNTIVPDNRTRSAAGDYYGPLTSTRRHQRRHTTPRLQPCERSTERVVQNPAPAVLDVENKVLFTRTLPDKASRRSLERRSASATPSRGGATVHVTSLDRARDLCNRLSTSLSPMDVRHLAKSAYTEEYMKNMDGVDRMLSVSASKTSDSENNSLLPPGGPTPLRLNRRRSKTEPGLFRGRVLADKPSPGQAYGESPYSQEYLHNMDGVRLVVNLSAGSADGGQTRASSSPGKSILKKSGSLGRVSLSGISDIKGSSPEKSVVTSAYPSPEKTVEVVEKSKNRSSCASERSLHLSDLPSEQEGVYEKFRNFDSQISTLPMATAAQQAFKPSINSQRPLAAGLAQVSAPKVRSEIFRNFSQENARQTITAMASQPTSRKEEDTESTERSSVSTVRDHAGRIEFLRQLQTNTGVRMPALMRDVTINRDVMVEEEEMEDREVRLGLSDNQQAYAEKLVRKYTKRAKKP